MICTAHQYYWSDQIQKMLWTGYEPRMMQVSRGFTVGKPEGKRPLG